MKKPDYIFETSWEVCNRVGGIYAVLSTRAATMVEEHANGVLFFGPDWGEHSDIYFEEDPNLFPGWQRFHSVRTGYWRIPGKPVAILLRWEKLELQKDAIYAWAWERYGVQSHAAYGDYDESCLYGFAAGQVMESLYHYLHLEDKNVVMHANEWQTAFSLFYLNAHCPKIGTLFTTHATSIGRSIAGNGKPLYDYFHAYNGDQMAAELNMVSKHSVEKQAAYWADCFTTVSDLTAQECTQLLGKTPDIVTPNGFEPGFVPKGTTFTRMRNAAREALADVAKTTSKNPFMLCIAGRQEWKNKGIDIFLHSMERLGRVLEQDASAREVLAFVMIPYLERETLHYGKVTVVFIPYYLNGHDPIFGKTYYDLLIGMDATVFPSYYEPWGYTPLESIAFKVPTITTSLAGFGVWAHQQGCRSLRDGVAIIPRNDSNYWKVVDQIAEELFAYMHAPAEIVKKARLNAAKLAEKAEWKHFFAAYREAYNIALHGK